MKQPIDPLISYLKMSQDLANLLSHLETEIEHDSNNPELIRNLSNRLQGIARQMKPKEQRDLPTPSRIAGALPSIKSKVR